MKNYKKYLILYILLTFISCSDGGEDETVYYRYHTPEDIDLYLSEIQSNYPDIVRIETAGTSKSGRAIKALIISDHPETLEGEPAIRLTGGIHGDEKMGIELLLRFIEYLTLNYAGNSTVKNLVNNRYICIIPVLNPDGLARSRRWNDNDVDLNRNFNDAGNHWSGGSDRGNSAFSEPETLALVNFSSLKNFNLSITYHIGAVLVNLPFDYGSKTIEGIFPAEEALIKSYALTYTEGPGSIFLTNPDVYNYVYNSIYGGNIYLDKGTINGGDWYVITGSLQDWSLTETGCLDLTIELAKNNPSTEDGVQRIFMYNRDSIMAYIQSATTDIFTGNESP